MGRGVGCGLEAPAGWEAIVIPRARENLADLSQEGVKKTDCLER